MTQNHVASDINSKYFYRRKMQKYVKILCNHTRVICKSKIVIGAIIIQCTLRLLRYPNLYHWIYFIIQLRQEHPKGTGQAGRHYAVTREIGVTLNGVTNRNLLTRKILSPSDTYKKWKYGGCDRVWYRRIFRGALGLVDIVWNSVFTSLWTIKFVIDN